MTGDAQGQTRPTRVWKAVRTLLGTGSAKGVAIGMAMGMGLVAGLGAAHAASPAIHTPFGTVSVDGNSQLQLNGEPLSNPHSEEPFLPHEAFAHVAGPWNAILLSGNESPNCVQFQWLTLSQQDVRWTPVFGTCDIKIKVSVVGDELSVAMRTQMEGKRRKPVTFVLKGNSFGQREQFPEWPEGYVKWPK